MINFEKKFELSLPDEDSPQEEKVLLVMPEEIKEYSNDFKLKLRDDPEVQALTSEIVVNDLNTILFFGDSASKGISNVSDSLLLQMKEVKAEESGELIVKLTRVMDKFDPKEFEKFNTYKEQGVVSKLFNKAKDTIDKLFTKYEDLGTEVDKIYVVLKKYEAETRQSNMNLEQMAKANVETYETLEKYIVAGELAKEEVDKYIAEYEVKAQNPDDQKAALIYQSLLQARDMLDQRIYDLRISENVAMQTIPMIQMIQLGNYNLIRKINSAFLITLPIFKQCLTQAIMLKRQELQARSMQVLDDKTNELLIRNANSVSKNAATLAKMAGTSSIKIETIEETWRTITNGISETKKIQETNKNDREKNTIKLEEFKKQVTGSKYSPKK
ncbi:TelA-like protein SA1238 [Sebaldella termitidis]|uniref:Toxic anion resistance family protein n=1 Tax=Sebaldella termitidis (strain ATCC 33386 / NCTC 11300) TaxID=526218 RepID=D1AI73_SEBTE|nr:toxic anion resistance protein [Sebaldella termitidis]ACZ08457.1 toxic anion resistance family protein [Sebaldella termitidis ATCC 33386]SUI23770.1 TelA-like protein SA1238 [Sebaldella termitidis]